MSNQDQGSMFSKFKSNKYVGGTEQFLQSNTMVAKVAFFILVVICFVYALRLGTYILSWFFSPSPNPHLIDGMIDSTHIKVFPQNPNLSGSVPIMRSVNARDGLEFTWSVWVYFDGIEYKKNEFRHIFHKGNTTYCKKDNPINNCMDYSQKIYGDNLEGLITPNNAPGLYLMPYVQGKTDNDLLVLMNTYGASGQGDITEYIQISDIPINKWVNVIIRCENTKVDVFINGTVVKRHVLKGVPRQNYDDVYMSMNGGFQGNTSNLWYYDHAIGVSKIQDIVSKGPNTRLVDQNMLGSIPYYLSLRWFFAGQGDMYNPTNEHARNFDVDGTSSSQAVSAASAVPSSNI